MAMTATVKSWRLDSAVRGVEDLLRRLRRQGEHDEAQAHESRTEDARREVAELEERVLGARVRSMAGESVNVAAIEAQITGARERLRTLEMAPGLAERAAKYAASTSLARAAEAPMQQELDAIAERYRQIVPKLRAAVEAMASLNAEVGILDQQLQSDFDHNHPAVRGAHLRWPTKPRIGGLSAPFRQRDVEGWLHRLQELGW